ncbi:unnamed protein product [Lupinus luteus]|uniref:Uncharacterized protein n=1 Tax=Lupinus luteus TaxID=3873 RepID=A0AAV1XWI5_LUPLU
MQDHAAAYLCPWHNHAAPAQGFWLSQLGASITPSVPGQLHVSIAPGHAPDQLHVSIAPGHAPGQLHVSIASGHAHVAPGHAHDVSPIASGLGQLGASIAPSCAPSHGKALALSA